MIQNGERRLLSVQKIEKIEAIPNADKIEVASILGWKVVVGKGEFKEGDYCVYGEIDTVFPDKPAFEFLRERKFRIKTIKLRGQISQGIIFPLNVLSNFVPLYSILSLEKLQEINLDEFVGVTKYDSDTHDSSSNLSGPTNTTLSKFPSFFPKTDQERIQNIFSKVLNLAQSQQDYDLYEVSEKLDGSSKIFFSKDGKLRYCSRNYELRRPTTNKFVRKTSRTALAFLRKFYKFPLLFNFRFVKSWHREFVSLFSNIDTNPIEEGIIKKYNLEKICILGRNLAFQGELIGPKIQGNKYQLDDYDWKIFDIFDIDNQRFLNPKERIEMLDALQLPSVPIIHSEFSILNLLKGNEDVSVLLKFAEGKSQLDSSTEREGLVFKRLNGNSFSFKAISNKWLLKENE